MKSRNDSIMLKNEMLHQPRKRFGQNFLRDQNVINRIMDAFDPNPSDHLVEIGPGQGALTEPLAATGARLDCIELDRDLAKYLKTLFGKLTGNRASTRWAQV